MSASNLFIFVLGFFFHPLHWLHQQRWTSFSEKIEWSSGGEGERKRTKSKNESENVRTRERGESVFVCCVLCLAREDSKGCVILDSTIALHAISAIGCT